MKRSDIVRAFDQVQPTQEQTDRMLENILNSGKKSRFEWRSFVPAIAAALVVITVLAGFKALDTAGKLPVSLEGFVDTAKSFFKGEDKNSSTLITQTDPADDKNSPTKSSTKAETDGAEAVQTTAAEPEKTENKFTLNFVTYKEVTEELAKDLPVDGTVKKEDVGALISTVAEGSTPFGGFDVYEYLPVKGRFFTVLENKDGSYKLFMFDKAVKDDIKLYFDVFGITSAEDIASVTVSEGDKTVEVEDIQKVFDELSKAESDKLAYENAVKSLVKPAPAAEQETTAVSPQEEKIFDESEDATEAVTVPVPDNADPNLAETVFRTLTLKIKTVSGLVYETEFYPQIDYISTCKISNDFSEFLKTVLYQ